MLYIVKYVDFYNIINYFMSKKKLEKFIFF